MKIKIDQDGFLMIQRRTNFRTVHCPIMKNSLCGDWCALFGEPDRYESPFFNEKYIRLELCHRIFKIENEDFEDER